MTISSLENGHSAVILGLNVEKQLLDRLLSLGFAKSKIIKKIKTSLGGSTIVVELDRSCVILRKEEAKSIQVEEING
ncbi:hypothetical protein B6S12_02110 [Helicobacter valdiviensis]|uniref:Ferrous iron transporter FeoA-like domain-containing protein n=1 Tax=Helicobacter valdiviensis TaxID=1458358 RepID=A0A2W6NIY7_9HELI|nr:FeoA domain-containing protein [Helicobacter valdiviensis]PZT48860.1 hypothetical protein B6S12_02110 [Helicobacter valdiviensis]